MKSTRSASSGWARRSSRAAGPSAAGRPRPKCATCWRPPAAPGLGFLDAGQAQASAEQMLGAQMPRPAPFNILIRSVRGDRGPDAVETEVRATLARLGLTKARAIVVQSASDLFAPPGRRSGTG